MNTHRVLITSLYGGVSGGKLRYYYSVKDDRASYCDALLSAEASCKYVLAHHIIDEIVTFGSKSTFDEGDGLKSLLLKEGSAFYASGVKDMSTYSLFRYRLAEYLDEVNIEEQDIRELLNDDEKAKVEAFVEKFFYSKENTEKTQRYSRFFDHVMQDVNLRDSFVNGLKEEIPEAKEDPDRFLTWTYQKLYNEMKSSAKLELLEANSNVKIRFIPVAKDDEEATFIENFTKIMNDIIAEGNDKIELYICVQSEDASDTYVLINLMNLIKAMPDADISVAKVITTTKNPEDAVATISDDTLKFGISDLVAGTRAFLQYGKTDMLLEFWHKSGLDNPEIERLLYAMRNIDYGISLCDISDIMRGIKSLRDLLKDVKEFKGNTFVERFFEMIAHGIKQDYGSLVANDDIVFIDLVKWAYRKGFWQQTLTLIESRAPEDIVDRGFYYYSDSPAASQEVVKIFGQIYYDLKPYEKYKLDDPYILWKNGNWNWDTFYEMCKKFLEVKPDGNPWITYNAVDYMDFSGYTLFKFDGKSYTSAIGDQNIYQCLKKMCDYRKSNIVSEAVRDQKVFPQGNSLFLTFNSIANRKTNANLTDVKQDGDLYCVPIPTIAGREDIQTFSELEAYGIPKCAKNAGAVYYFLRYYLDANNYDANNFFTNKQAYEVYQACMAKSEFAVSTDGEILGGEVGGGLAGLCDYIRKGGDASQLQHELDEIAPKFKAAADKANDVLKQFP